MTAASPMPDRFELLGRLVKHWHREIAREVGSPVAFSISILPPERERGWRRRVRTGRVEIRESGFDSQCFDLLVRAVERWQEEIAREVGAPVGFSISVSPTGETEIDTYGF